MKKSIIYVSLFASTLLTVSACKEGGGNEPSLENSRSEGPRAQYTCSMHPEVISNVSGRCPKCGMDLIEKRTGSEVLPEKDIPSHAETPIETGTSIPKTASTDSAISSTKQNKQ